MEIITDYIFPAIVWVFRFHTITGNVAVSLLFLFFMANVTGSKLIGMKCSARKKRFIYQLIIIITVAAYSIIVAVCTGKNRNNTLIIYLWTSIIVYGIYALIKIKKITSNKIVIICIGGAQIAVTVLGIYAVYIWNAFSDGDIEDMYTLFCGIGTVIIQAVILNITKRACDSVKKEMEAARLKEEEKARQDSYTELLDNYTKSEQVVGEIKEQLATLKEQMEKFNNDCKINYSQNDEKEQVLKYIELLERQIDMLMKRNDTE